MTKYTFTLKNNNSTFYTPKYKSTDYSKVLDDLIAADIAEKNSWLGMTTPKKSNDAIIDAIIKDASKTDFEKACAFLNNYKKTKCPFIKDKIYYLTDGTPFYLTDDYITIGFNTYYFYEFGKPTFLYNLSESMKKTICTIFVDGLKITIKK